VEFAEMLIGINHISLIATAPILLSNKSLLAIGIKVESE